MNWSLYRMMGCLLLFVTATQAAAQQLPLPSTDSIVAKRSASPSGKQRLREIRDSLLSDTTYSRYDRRRIKALLRWSSLIPNQAIVQRAGNMGYLSFGVGWDYGKHAQWETHLLLGFLPKYDSRRAKLTMSLKETFIPWRWTPHRHWQIDPLVTGIYFNTVFGSEFWGKQPARYPDDYYQFLSTKVRVNIFVGQQYDFLIPNPREHWAKKVDVFWEVSTCDLYLRALVTDRYVTLKDVLSLSVGVKVHLF